MSDRELRISLSNSDFKTLIEGKILEKKVVTDGTIDTSHFERVHISFKKIDYHKMIELITNAANK